MTHKELVDKAKTWLIQSKSCNPVFIERGSQRISEMPDAIGWTANDCLIVECKTSLADFNCDKNKSCREDGAGMGSLRYFLIPYELKQKVEGNLPQGWGLLVAHEDGRPTEQVRLMRSQEHSRNYKNEVFYLRSRVLEIQRYGQ